MERECNFDRLRQWLIDYVPSSGIDYPRFLERLDAAFPVTPAPASNKCDCDTFDGAHPQSWCDKPAPTPEIPEAVYRAAHEAFNHPTDYSKSWLENGVTAAIAAYREHLRARPGPSDDELRAALDDYQFNPQCEFASRLRAVAEAVKARLLGDKP